MIRYRGRFVREWYWPRGEPFASLHPLVAMHTEGHRLLLRLATPAVGYRWPKVRVEATVYSVQPMALAVGEPWRAARQTTITLDAVHVGGAEYAVALPHPTGPVMVEVLSAHVFPQHAPRRAVDCPKPCARCGCRVFEWTERWDDDGNEWEETWCKRCGIAKG